MTPADDPLQAARAVLAPGEQLVWADRPDPQVLARSKLPQVIRGGLGLAVIAAFLWLSFLPHWPGGGAGLALAAFLLVALLYCVWLLAQPAIARRAAGRVVYAVTDRRVLIAEDWPFRRVESFAPAELDEPLVMRAASGRDSVVFVNRKRPWWRRSAGGSYQIEALYGVADAEGVAAAIAGLKTGGEAPPQEDA